MKSTLAMIVVRTHNPQWVLWLDTINAKKNNKHKTHGGLRSSLTYSFCANVFLPARMAPDASGHTFSCTDRPGLWLCRCVQVRVAVGDVELGERGKEMEKKVMLGWERGKKIAIVKSSKAASSFGKHSSSHVANKTKKKMHLTKRRALIYLMSDNRTL